MSIRYNVIIGFTHVFGGQSQKRSLQIFDICSFRAMTVTLTVSLN